MVQWLVHWAMSRTVGFLTLVYVRGVVRVAKTFGCFPTAYAFLIDVKRLRYYVQCALTPAALLNFGNCAFQEVLLAAQTRRVGASDSYPRYRIRTLLSPMESFIRRLTASLPLK